jgi:NitT/TauT family transport system substrate-binding protein
MPLKTRTACSTTLAAALWLAAPALAENVPVVFGTNWLAQAEHGGFYQAVADGTYAACGLDVTIQPGGPQVNNRALMIAGKVDYHMGGNLLEAFSAAQEGIPIVAVAAAFQKEPQVILAHPGKAKSFEDLKNLEKILIGDQGYASFYQWMKAAYGFTDEQREVYTFNPAPFIANENWGMQGYLSSEPFFVAKETGWDPEVFLIADAGYSTYSTLIETMAETIATKPEQVTCFVEGSIKGWYNYMYNDNTAANEMIKKDNPEMTDEAIAYAIDKMKSAGIVDSGDTETMGIGAMTEAKVKDFFDKMVAAGVVSAEVDWTKTINTTFVNKGVGMDLKPKM